MTERWVSLVKHLVMIFHFWMLTGDDRKLRSSVWSLRSSASGHHLTVGIRHSVFEEREHVACIARLDDGVLCPVDLTGASGHPELCPVKGYNGSISWGISHAGHDSHARGG